MNRAQEIIDTLLGVTAAPAPVAPPKPGTKPDVAPPRPRPGTRPWNPSVRPGVNPRPKARRPQDEHAFAEANTSVPVPPPPSEEDSAMSPEPPALPKAPGAQPYTPRQRQPKRQYAPPGGAGGAINTPEQDEEARHMERIHRLQTLGRYA